MRRRHPFPICLREPILLGAALAAFALPAPALAAPPGLDAGFGTDGVAKIDFGGKRDRAEAMAIAPDGKIVIVGDTYVGGAGTRTRDFAIARLNPDGTLDETFGSGGKRTIDFKPLGDTSWKDYATDVVIQPDGKIVVAGSSRDPDQAANNSLMTVIRLNASDGSTDLTFGNPVTPGVNHPPTGDNGTEYATIARFASGRFVVAGRTYGTTSGHMAWQGLNHLGQDDPTITDNMTFGTAQDAANDIAVTPGGGFVLAGGRFDSGAFDLDVAVARRLGTDGSADNTFNGNGRTTFGFGADSWEEAEAVAVQPDSKVLTVGGSDNAGFFVHRLTAVGIPDTTFGGGAFNGTAIIDFGGDDRHDATALQLLGDGKIAVAGQRSSSGGPNGFASDVAVTRLTGGGALDNSFGVGGKRVIGLPHAQFVTALAVQADGGFLVAGENSPSPAFGGGNHFEGDSAADFFVMRIGKFTPRRGPGGASPPPVAPGLARVAVSARSLRASAKGVVAVKVRCSAAAACGGTVDLTTARKVSVSAKKRKLKLARKSYSVAAGKSKTVKLKLRRSGLKLLRKRRKLRVRLTVTTRRAGAKAAKVGRTVTLSAAKKKRKR